MTESTSSKARRLAGNIVIDYRVALDVAVPVIVTVGFIATAQSDSFKAVLTAPGRSSLYTSLAATSGALLGFALTALAILVALPSTDRLEALRGHPSWPRVPGAFFRAGWALLIVLVISTLGIVIDAGAVPAKAYEAVTVFFVTLALVRIVGAIVALSLVMGVARTTAPLAQPIDDPGL
jgi:hypothetical protein